MSNQITIFGDTHANLPALEAVFRDMESRQLDNLYCLGGLVGYGTFKRKNWYLQNDWDTRRA